MGGEAFFVSASVVCSLSALCTPLFSLTAEVRRAEVNLLEALHVPQPHGNASCEIPFAKREVRHQAQQRNYRSLQKRLGLAGRGETNEKPRRSWYRDGCKLDKDARQGQPAPLVVKNFASHSRRRSNLTRERISRRFISRGYAFAKPCRGRVLTGDAEVPVEAQGCQALQLHQLRRNPP